MNDILIRRLHGSLAVEDARSVCDQVWPNPNNGTEITSNLLTAMEHAGGYVAAAYSFSEPQKPIGAVISFVGRHHENGQWRTHLHSHMTAVLDDYRDRNIGYLLKQDQRRWAIENGIETIAWTFDPLVRRNARLNIRKLGVDVKSYLPNFYGEMADALNQGDETDRLYVHWHTNSAIAQTTAGTVLPVIDVMPQSSLVIELPEDIVRLRATDPVAARDWRLRVREQFMLALASEMELAGLNRSDAYVFVPKASRYVA